MILYKEDFAKENAYVHTTTTNLSFIRMYQVYKQLGIVNNKFHLALLDRDLMNINVHDLKDNSLELKMRIINEAYNNPWYYFREVLRIDGAGSTIPFQAGRHNIAQIWLFLQGIDQIDLAPRQHGKTVGALGITSYCLIIRNKGTGLAMLAKDDVLRTGNISKLTAMIDSLPPWMVIRSTSDKNNATNIHYEENNTDYSTFVNQPNIIKAEKQGRGLTVVFQHWDEIAFYQHNDISFPAALSAMNAAVDEAKKNDQLYGIIMTTTAGLLSTKEGQFVYKNFISEGLQFSDFLYDTKDTAKLKEIVSKGSKANIVCVEYNPLQLGKSKEWIQEKTRKILAGENGADLIKRDYFNIWLYSSSVTTLPTEIVDKMKLAEREPLFIDESDGYLMYWYIPRSLVDSPIFKTIPVVAGLDGSENIGRDFTTFVLLDARNMQVIGRMRCNESNIFTIAQYIANFLVKHSNVLFIPERNSTGVTIIDIILIEFEKKRINPFLRIYNTYLEEESNGRDIFSWSNMHELIEEKRRLFGFRNSSSSRNLLYKNTFMRTVYNNYKQIFDKQIISEMVQLRVKNGRIDHQNNAHDDLVIAYLLACYVLYFSKCLHLYFGGKDIQYAPLCDYVETGSEDNHENDLINQFSDVISEIQQKEEELQSANSDFKRSQIIHELKYLRSLIPDEAISASTTRASMSDVVKSNAAADIETTISNAYSKTSVASMISVL
jgi:hypothetical protein